MNEIVKTGDILDICLAEQNSSENIVPRKCALDILYEDEDMLVLNKPHDTPIHPSGVTKEEGMIDLPIGREEGTIIKRKIDEKEGKRAVTHYCRIEVLHVEGKAVLVVALQLDTGRTHQIRVHMSSIGHSLLGDFLYNENDRMLTRRALHATECAFYHPVTGEYKKITAPLPKDMRTLMYHSIKETNESCDILARLQVIKW